MQFNLEENQAKHTVFFKCLSISYHFQILISNQVITNIRNKLFNKLERKVLYMF